MPPKPMAPKTRKSEKRCSKCNRPNKGCYCKWNAAKKALREEAKGTGIVKPELAKLREQSNRNDREQRAARKRNNFTSDHDKRRCKGPDGRTGTCQKLRASKCSPPGFSFCKACYRKAYPAASATVRAASTAAQYRGQRSRAPNWSPVV